MWNRLILLIPVLVALVYTKDSGELPDISIDKDALMRDPYITQTNISDIVCALEEKCLDMTSNFTKNPMRRLLRFTLKSCNKGPVDFKPAKPKSDWKYHACHKHVHGVDLFSRCTILLNGIKAVSSQKASFCLQDSVCPWDKFKVYTSCNKSQGITPGCCDIYNSKLDCQWIDITNLEKNRMYEFVVVVNPLKAIEESNYTNNIVTCTFWNKDYYYSRSKIITDCKINYRYNYPGPE